MLLREWTVAAVAVMLLPWSVLGQEREKVAVAPRAEVWRIGKSSRLLVTSSVLRASIAELVIMRTVAGSAALPTILDPGSALAVARLSGMTGHGITTREPPELARVLYLVLCIPHPR